ncbi:hypothetical protein KGF54_005212 [Candida jiufengensis]|uniref:uncharacterized protein n=1 Tax=Candida jiufengensis TaxID=497108 RepID=UPI002223FFA9|nr:uncharacterized protein KGF54_005212 [Candida jiufengensis]KAI5950255.1 hypothetical protein KGF54_005212 [Candida jiufengensis]
MSVPKHLSLPYNNNTSHLSTFNNNNNNLSTSTTTTPKTTSSPFNPRTHRHKRSQAISGDFDGLGLFNFPPSIINNNGGGNNSNGNNNQSSSTSSNLNLHSSHIYSKSISNSTTNSFVGSSQISSSSSVPKERSISFANDSRPNKLTLTEDNDFELNRHFNFNNKEDFANPIDLKTFEFPSPSPFQDKIYEFNDNNNDIAQEQDYEEEEDNTIYTTNFKKNLSSPIQLNNKISQCSLNSSKLQNQLNIDENIPDPVIDLDYILTANLHIGNSNDDTLIFNQDDYLGSPAIVEEDDDIEDQLISNDDDVKSIEDPTTTTNLNLLNTNLSHDDDLQQPSTFYSSANSSTSSFTGNNTPNLFSTTTNNNNMTPTQQRSGAKAHRYQIFYDQSNRISNAMKSSAESIDRSSTPPLQLQLQPVFRKKYLNHSSSLPSLKAKRSFSSIRYNELKKISSPTREYYRLQASLSPTKNQCNYNYNHNHNLQLQQQHQQNTNSIIANNHNITSEYVELPSNSLHPPIPQSSTPSTLATQSTTDTLPTTKVESSTSPISANSEISSMIINDKQSKEITPIIIINNNTTNQNKTTTTTNNNIFLINDLKKSNDESFQSDSTISNSPIIASSAPASISTKEFNQQPLQQNQQQQQQQSKPKRSPTSTEQQFLNQTQIPNLKKKLDSPMNKYEYKKYPHRNTKGQIKNNTNQDILSISSASTSSLTLTSTIDKKQVASTTNLPGSTTTTTTTTTTTNSTTKRSKGHFRSKSNIEDSLIKSKRSSKFFDWLRKK